MQSFHLITHSSYRFAISSMASSKVNIIFAFSGLPPALCFNFFTVNR